MHQQQQGRGPQLQPEGKIQQSTNRTLRELLKQQSQHRQSSLCQLKKAAAASNKAKAKSNGGKALVQVGLPGRKAFVALGDCQVCKLTQWRREGRRYPRNHKKAGQLIIVPHRGR